MKVLIACGGTAGHIFPGLALAEELKRQEEAIKIVLVVSTHPRDRDYLQAWDFPLTDIQIETVGALPLPYKLSPRLVYFGMRLFWACLKSLVIILRHRPAGAVGFGGYASFAPVMVARLMGIPALIHEQNLIPGRANRWLARVADRIAVTFDDTVNLFSRKNCAQKVVKTGLPLRRQILAYSSAMPNAQRKRFISSFLPAQKMEKAEKGGFTLVVLGGSQGAHRINELILDCLTLMSPRQRMHLQVIHLTGKRDYVYVQRRYQKLQMDFRVFDFVKDMPSIYRNADLLIGRCGASTIFEAAAFGLPCLFIPSSYGTAHQRENAQFLKRNGYALILEEDARTARDLERMLGELMSNKRRRQALAQRIKLLAVPQASYNLCMEVLALCQDR